MNIQNSLYLRDKSFRFDQCNTCQLFIRISQKSFSFAICDTADKQVHALYQSGSLKSAEEIMDELNRESGYFTQNFETVKIIIETFSFTFIPES